MNAEEFKKLVSETFKFLVDEFGFAATACNGFSVRLDSQRVFVYVIYDAVRSREISVRIGLQKGIQFDVERPFELHEILRLIGQAEMARTISDLNATVAELAEKIGFIGKIMLTFGNPFLKGDCDVFIALNKQRDIDCIKYASARDLAVARRQATVAWNNGRYDEFLRILTPLTTLLKPSEVARIAIAKKQLR